MRRRPPYKAIVVDADEQRAALFERLLSEEYATMPQIVGGAVQLRSEMATAQIDDWDLVILAQDAPGVGPSLNMLVAWLRHVHVLSGSIIAIVTAKGYNFTRVDRMSVVEDFNRQLGQEEVKRLLAQSLPSSIAEQPVSSAELSTPPDSLVQACADGDCALYVGAGLSASLGLPTWRPLLQDLVTWCGRRAIVDRRFVESLRGAISSRTADDVADHIVSAVRRSKAENELLTHLRELFFAPKVGSSPTYEILQDLSFNAVLTTNFDEVLECTFPNSSVYTPLDTEPLLDDLTKRRFFILKLYGSLDRPESVLLSPRQYEDTIVGNPAFSQFMENLFVSRTLLFLGASLEGIEAYLRGIKFRGTLSRQHYALVAVSGTAWRLKAETLSQRYQIQVLPYVPSTGQQEVHDFLQDLLVQTRSRRRTSHRRREPARLRRLRLESIGPFDELDLLLDPQLNVLLGDNGVGKSNVMRAIAAALCGRDAQPYADRLMKYDRTSGKIVLETTAGLEYVTELFRTSGEAEVKPLPSLPSLRPFEAEGWLALGFPALRTVSWQRPRGPELEESKKRPVLDDLRPLLVGDPDPRTDELKQWMVNIDYRAKGGASEKASRYARQLDDFFRIVGRLTGNVKIGFARVDVDRRMVLLSTDDGEVPLEAVSQGTVSLLGWIGVLVERLYEVFDEEDEPTNQYALVLIDEIDAHMHPAWQQDLIPSLTEVFPKVQFIATTHSPLVVSGMDVKQVCRLVRDKDAHVSRLDVPADMTYGRTHQILTSCLFGLDTTVSPQARQLLIRYEELLGKETRTQDEEDEFMKLSGQLPILIPPAAHETPLERRAYDLFSSLVKGGVGDEFPALKKELLAKAKLLFDELGQKKEPLR